MAPTATLDVADGVALVTLSNPPVNALSPGVDDGILAGLYMLDFMVRTGKKPTELLQMLFEKVGGEYFYDRIDSAFSGDRAAREAESLARHRRRGSRAARRRLFRVALFEYL